MSPDAALSGLLEARSPAVYFDAKIGDSILTLPTVRALGQMFSAPITMICPKVAFDLCFREVSDRHVEIPGFLTHGVPSRRPPDIDALAAQIGPVDLFVNTTVLRWPSETGQALRRRVAPATSIGFANDNGDYDVVVAKEACHSVELCFKLAQLFDPAARADTYSQPAPIPSPVQQQTRAMRAGLPAGVKVLVVHADTDCSEKRWPITRFIDVLDRLLARHDDFVAWVVGMGEEELNVGYERDRVIPHLGLPLDLAMGLVAEADLFLGVDSCMLHAADLARFPGVGLFGLTRSMTWGFRFGPHRHIDRRSMSGITVADVLGAVEDLSAEHGL
ncbi:glycosyltransferase family 9 protein, partial [Mycobacterium sp. Lab-001]|uniref:glycosyltransferase family 9 protein n=1 Tax=Mycobacterium sp. Lab-001 TaxID=3410136 RepID=UPI003D164839